MKNKKNNSGNNDYPYMMCTIYGFDRVPDTIVLLKTEDYTLFMKYLKKAANEDPDADIILDPDDCGECYTSLGDFMKYSISAKPIKAETYEDICYAYKKEQFGFNYVLDAVLETIFLVLKAELKPKDIKWFMLRSTSVEWRIQDENNNAQQSAKINTQQIYDAANEIKNCSNEICQLIISKNAIDMHALRENAENIANCIDKIIEQLS